MGDIPVLNRNVTLLEFGSTCECVVAVGSIKPVRAIGSWSAFSSIVDFKVGAQSCLVCNWVMSSLSVVDDCSEAVFLGLSKTFLELVDCAHVRLECDWGLLEFCLKQINWLVSCADGWVLESALFLETYDSCFEVRNSWNVFIHLRLEIFWKVLKMVFLANILLCFFVLCCQRSLKPLNLGMESRDLLLLLIRLAQQFGVRNV